MPEEQAESILIDMSERASIGRYQMVRKVGDGRTGGVYECFDPIIDRPVAVKVSALPTARVRENFFIEAKSAARLAHKNIVTVYDANLVGGEYGYIAMEYVNGPLLSVFCDPENLLPLTLASEIVLDICLAMEHAHKAGVIHRDLNPGAILLHENQHPKITQFRIKDTGGSRRSPSYMSPEQLQDVPGGPQSDVFAVGCILYELVSGHKAFEGKDAFATMYKVINEEPPPLSSPDPNFSPIFERIVRRALTKDIRRRYQNFAQMSYDMKLATRGLTSPVKKDKLEDVIDYVHSVAFFSGFARSHIEDLIAATELLQVKKDQVMVSEGDLDDAFYILLSGKGRVMKGETRVGTLNAGECFGEMAFIAGQSRTASVVAEEDGAMMKISGSVLDRAPARLQLLFFKKFALTLTQRLATLSRKAAEG
ncbi:MAG: serine/threonine-protein kinase [Pseudomonadota bacterium]